jgi:hypothetical protein
MNARDAYAFSLTVAVAGQKQSNICTALIKLKLFACPDFITREAIITNEGDLSPKASGALYLPRI